MSKPLLKAGQYLLPCEGGIESMEASALCTLSQSSSLATPFVPTVIFSMEENEPAPFKGGSVFAIM